MLRNQTAPLSGTARHTIRRRPPNISGRNTTILRRRSERRRILLSFRPQEARRPEGSTISVVQGGLRSPPESGFGPSFLIIAGPYKSEQIGLLNSVSKTTMLKVLPGLPNRPA